MPKYFCEYCGIYLTHSSPGGRNQHYRGRKHINNKIEYYSQILYEFQQNINTNLVQMTSHILNKPKDQLKNISNQNEINNNENKDILIQNKVIENTKEIPLKKAVIHIPGQIPFSVPQYIPNIPINEKIMKAIPNKLIPSSFKMINGTYQDDLNKKEIVDINEGEKLEEESNNQKNVKNNMPPSKNILENLKRMKYSYNDPNPENNGHLLQDLFNIEGEEDQNNEIKK